MKENKQAPKGSECLGAGVKSWLPSPSDMDRRGGETQALGTVTLGTKSDTQGLDAVTGGPEEKKFMLHYNFPPYSTGEVGRLGSTGRREIGHGALAGQRSYKEY